MWLTWPQHLLYMKKWQISLGVNFTPYSANWSRAAGSCGSQFTEISLNVWPWFTVVQLSWNSTLSLADSAIQSHCQWCRAKNGCSQSSWWAQTQGHFVAFTNNPFDQPSCSFTASCAVANLFGNNRLKTRLGIWLGISLWSWKLWK